MNRKLFSTEFQREKITGLRSTKLDNIIALIFDHRVVTSESITDSSGTFIDDYKTSGCNTVSKCKSLAINYTTSRNLREKKSSLPQFIYTVLLQKYINI